MAGIAADQHSHVKHFPSVPAYDDYYDLIVAIGEIGVESFATRVQELLVAYLRVTYGDDPANWCFKFWTGNRGRMCLAHARYAGCNNNMGVDRIAQREKLPLELHELKSVLMPRQWWLRSPETGSRRLAHRSRTAAETGTARARVQGRRLAHRPRTP